MEKGSSVGKSRENSLEGCSSKPREVVTQVGVKAGLSLMCRIIGEMGTVSLPLQPDKLDGQCLSFPVPGPSSTWVRTNPQTPFRISAVRWHVTARRQAEMALGYKVRIRSWWLGISQGQAGLEPEGAWWAGQKSIFEAEGQARGWGPSFPGPGRESGGEGCRGTG